MPLSGALPECADTAPSCIGAGWVVEGDDVASYRVFQPVGFRVKCFGDVWPMGSLSSLQGGLYASFVGSGR